MTNEAGAAMAVALLLAITNQKIIDFIAEPVRKEMPDVDLWWLTYISLITGLVISLAANINLFTAFLPQSADIVGKILTGVLVGGGASLIHDIFDGGGN